MNNVLSQFNFNINSEIHKIRNYKASYWSKLTEEHALRLFRFVSKTVPAYKKFLKENGINSAQVKDISDFKKLPIITKDNYLRKYPYEELFPYAELQKSITFSATSGSTGEPFYFPRINIHDLKYELGARLFFEDQFEAKKKKSLGILGFGLGIWIGGIMTYRVLYQMAVSGYKISIVPTGPNKEQFLGAIKRFGHLYDQIILMGYPPFIKDVLDEGIDYHIDWKNYEIKIFTAAEGFSERFKMYLAKKAHLKNFFSDMVNLYGSVEMGLNGHETSLTSLIRHLAFNDRNLFKELFPEATNVPTLCQYYPQFIYYEQVEIDGRNEVIATGYGTQIPLIRYRFKDLGGVIPYETMMEKLKAHGINIQKELKRYHIKPNIIYPLPFVYVYERSDFTVSLVGIILYPEYIRQALLRPMLQKYLTGKFSMQVVYDKNYNQKLQVQVELKKNVKASTKLKELIIKEVLNSLKENSTEFNHLWSTGSEKYRKQLQPDIFLHLYEDPKYFRPGIKQKWIIK